VGKATRRRLQATGFRCLKPDASRFSGPALASSLVPPCDQRSTFNGGTLTRPQQPTSHETRFRPGSHDVARFHRPVARPYRVLAAVRPSAGCHLGAKRRLDAADPFYFSNEPSSFYSQWFCSVWIRLEVQSVCHRSAGRLSRAMEADKLQVLLTPKDHGPRLAAGSQR
jgi:hypothetical protein